MQKITDPKTGVYFLIPDGWEANQEGIYWYVENKQVNIGFFVIAIYTKKISVISRDKEEHLTEYLLQENIRVPQISLPDRFAYAEYTNPDSKNTVATWMTFVDDYPVFVEYICKKGNENLEADLRNALLRSINSNKFE
jgi:hypothetical protein